MNKQNIQTSVYAQKVDLLLRLLPLIMEKKCLQYMEVRQSISSFLEICQGIQLTSTTHICLADSMKIFSKSIFLN